MPFTSNKGFKENPRLITGAKGVYLKNHHGRTMIDASSGLFCNPLGHGRKEITNAVAKQLEELDDSVIHKNSDIYYTMSKNVMMSVATTKDN